MKSLKLLLLALVCMANTTLAQNIKTYNFNYLKADTIYNDIDTVSFDTTLKTTLIVDFDSYTIEIIRDHKVLEVLMFRDFYVVDETYIVVLTKLKQWTLQEFEVKTLTYDFSGNLINYKLIETYRNYEFRRYE